MADEATTSTVAAPAATPEAKAPAGVPPSQERGRALIEKHVRMAQEASASEAKQEYERTEPKGELLPKTPTKDPVTGKFLKAGQKPTAKAVEAKPVGEAATVEPKAKVDAKAAPVPDATGGLGKARRLASEGKVNEALELIGLSPDKIPHGIWKTWRVNSEKVASAIQAERAQVDDQKAELDRVARQLSAEFKPYHDAKQAYAAGDYEEAFKLAFGEDLNGFQRKALQRMANPGIGKDPAITSLQQENAELKKMFTELTTKQQADQQTERIQRHKQQVWDNMVTELKGADDERITTVAERRAFQERVWKTLAKHYDPNTDSTLPVHEAAELALEQIAREVEELGGTFGGGKSASDAVRDRVASNPVATDQGRNPARRPARAATSLSTSEAAEAAPERKLKGKALMEHFVRLAESQRQAG